VTGALPAALAAALRDRYRLEPELGQGGMATVYLAHDRKHDRDVALKVLRPELAAVLGAERFLREIQLTAKLQHPHILPLLDSGEAAGLFFYVMPYVEGESLRDRLERDKQLPIEEALRLTTEVAEALDYAHQQGVIHRDIKPENILLSRGHALVADFGIALAVTQAGGGRLTETGLSLGTPAYMSPEQAMAETDLDARTDQYSLACVLYEMLAGEPPYTGPTAQAIIAKRLNEPLPHLSTIREVPAHVGLAVTRALAKTRVDRFPTVAEFSKALRGGRPAPTPARRRTRAWALAAALGILSVVIVGLVRTRRVGPLDPRRVVIAPFDNRTGDASLQPLGLMVAEWLTQGLTSTALVEVVDSRSLAASVQDLRQQGSSGDLARDLAKTTRARTLVSGSVYRLGDSLRFQAQVHDAGTNKLLATVDPVTVTAANPASALEPLRQRVTGALATMLDDRLNSQAAETSRPPTYEAYQEFLLGMENYGRDLETDLGHFRRAASLDTSYTQALLWLGIAHSDLEQYRQADSVFQLVEARRSHLAPYDQANLDYFRRGFVQGDWEGSYRGARRMLELAPAAEHAKFAVAVAGMLSNRPREAVDIVRTIDTSRGWGRSWRRIVLFVTARARHTLGEYEDELRAANALAADSSKGPAAEYVRFRALVGLRRRDEAMAHIPQDSLGGGAQHAGELLAHGYPDESRVMATKEVAWFRTRTAAEPHNERTRRDLGLALLAAGQWREARAAALEGLRRDTAEVAWHGILGLAAAHNGDQATANRELQVLSTWPPAYLFGGSSWWRARILGAQGRLDEAIAALEQAYREGLRANSSRGYPALTGHLESEEFDAIRKDVRVQALLHPR